MIFSNLNQEARMYQLPNVNDVGKPISSRFIEDVSYRMRVATLNRRIDDVSFQKNARMMRIYTTVHADFI